MRQLVLKERLCRDDKLVVDEVSSVVYYSANVSMICGWDDGTEVEVVNACLYYVAVAQSIPLTIGLIAFAASLSPSVFFFPSIHPISLQWMKVDE